MNKNYKELSKIKVLGVNNGLEFVSSVIDNLESLVAESNKDLENLSELYLYDFRYDKKIKIKVNSKMFQALLDERYAIFIKTKILINYNWFKQVKNCIIKMLKSKFNYDSDIIINFFLKVLIDVLSLSSCGENCYNYNKVLNLLKQGFGTKDLSKEDIISFSISIIDCLEQKKLILIEKRFFFKKNFRLSDKFIDSFFRLNSINLVNFFDFENSKKIYDSQQEIINLKTSIEKFDTRIKNILGLKELKNFLTQRYPNIVEQIEDYTLYDLDSEIVSTAPDHLVQTLYGIFFHKMLLNEYCFNKVVASCFYNYYYKTASKNILYKENLHKIFN